MTLREAAGAGRTVGELPGDALVEPENMVAPSRSTSATSFWRVR